MNKELIATINNIKRLHVHLSHGDIRRGSPHLALSCPTARAITRAAKQRLKKLCPQVDVTILVSVIPSAATISVNRYLQSFVLPKKIQRFIYEFDTSPDGRIRFANWHKDKKDTDVYTSFYIKAIEKGRKL